MLLNIINVLTAPASTFETLIDRDSLKDALMPIVVLFIMAMFTGWLLQDLIADMRWTEIEQRIENDSSLDADQKSETLEKFYDRIYNQGSSSIVDYIMMGIWWPIRIAIMALFALLIGNVFFGGGATYGKIFIITAFAYSASVIEYLIKTPVQYFSNKMEIYTGLGILGLGEKGSFLNNYLAGMDIFSVWRIVLISMGMGLLYKKTSKSFLIALGVFWLLVLAVFSALGAVSR